eukprot:TRINITY_DN2893_c0_g1_i4.p1 TRINITY_DN2893_c0_g1~~TRINITY_DN2893_c0_g1_i4.p1  ORF type:complete len:411 (+),score=78.63 TRINITY_DN2893_c0_g1_i4:114-1346(+)
MNDLYCKIEAGRSYHLKEFPVLVLAKSRYVVPLTMKVIELPDFSNERAFATVLTVNKALLQYNVMYLLLDEHKNVAEITSNCASYLGITCSIIRSSAVHIDEVIPGFSETDEKRPTIMSCNGRNMRCTWERLTTREERVLGYRVQLALQQDEGSLLSLPEDLPLPDFQFTYSFKYNKYVAAAEGEKASIELPMQICISWSKTLDSVCNQSEHTTRENKEKTEMQEGNYSLFYGQLIKRYEMLFPGKTDDYFLSTCKGKKNHGQNVETYRINAKDGRFLLVDKYNAVKTPEDTLESIMASSEGPSSRQKANKGIKKIFKTTIKTKGYLVKLLSNLPLPLTFSIALLFAFLCMIIASVAGILGYKVCSTLFAKVHDQMSVIKVQTERISNLLEISTSILNVIGYNKYSSSNL